MADPALFALWYPVFLFSLTLHEAAHAWAAKRGGDLTAYAIGQVSLNPVPHMQREPIGTIAVPLLTYLASGWMMGWASTPLDPRWARRYPKRAGWMALAGPAANFFLVVVAALLMWLGVQGGVFVAPPDISMTSVVRADGPWAPLGMALSILFSLNLLLGTFNLMPVPPLDGAAALSLVLPGELAERWQDLMAQPMWGFLGLILAWNLFGPVFSPIYNGVLGALFGLLGFF